MKTHGGTESSQAFTRVVGNILASRQGQYGTLTFTSGPKLCPHDRPAAKCEQCKYEELLKSKTPQPRAKTPEQIAEERARAVSHIASQDPNDPYHSTVRQINPDSPLGRHRAMVESAMKQAAAAKQNDSSPYDDSYWAGRVDSLLNSIQSTLIRSEVETFAKRLNPEGEQKFRAVESFLNRRQTERSLAGRI